MNTSLAKRPKAETAQTARQRFKRVLVAVDFSNDSRKALICAAELAAEFDASLTLVHVVEPRGGPRAADLPALTGDASEAVKFAEAKLELNDLAAQMLGPCRMVETLIRCGLAFFEITEAAKALGVDLIVLGTHGYAGLQRDLLGSTVEKVVRHAPCPVLVARGETTRIAL